jgi:hypothetical protein
MMAPDIMLAADAPTVFLPRSLPAWVVGVDVGQTSDPSALCVLEHVKGVLDSNTLLERHTSTGRRPQISSERLDVRHLERLPLGLSYPAVAQRVKDLLAEPPLCGYDKVKPAELVIDETGVGRAVGDIFVAAGMKPKRVSITAGSEVTAVGGDRWHVAKTVLISTVDAMLHRGVLRFAAALAEAPTMRDELLDFRRKLSDAGRATYSARTGAHDDLVLAVAIACWWCSRPRGSPAGVGTW